jgi:hypothetical protein
MYKQHNPAIAQPYLDELLEKLGSDWSDYSWGNNLSASIGCEYKEHKHIEVLLPNSLKDDLNNECFNDFTIQLEDSSTGEREIKRSLTSVSQVIIYVTNFLKVQIK